MSRFLLIISCIFLVLSSCSRTVTDRSTTLFVEIILTFRSPIQRDAYNYVLTFSDDTNTEILYPETYPEENYLIIPGLTYDENELDTLELEVVNFYEDYFDTWQDVISIHDDQIQLIQSNDSFFDATTSANNTYEPSDVFEYESNFLNNPSVLVLSFDLEQIDANLSGEKQFKFSVLESSETEKAGILLEVIDLTDAVFEITVNEDTGFQSDIEEEAIDGSADILSWRVRVY
jgi:hypothetical protein